MFTIPLDASPRRFPSTYLALLDPDDIEPRHERVREREALAVAKEQGETGRPGALLRPEVQARPRAQRVAHVHHAPRADGWDQRKTGRDAGRCRAARAQRGVVRAERPH